MKQLGLVRNATSAVTTAHNSNTNEEKLDNQDTKKAEIEENLNEVLLLPKDRPIQKNKKKCWVCKSKLELAQRELGLCKCGKYLYNPYDVMGQMRFVFK